MSTDINEYRHRANMARAHGDNTSARTIEILCDEVERLREEKERLKEDESTCVTQAEALERAGYRPDLSRRELVAELVETKAALSKAVKRTKQAREEALEEAAQAAEDERDRISDRADMYSAARRQALLYIADEIRALKEKEAS